MNFIIAVFKSRNETLYLANMFKASGICVDIINTPKEAGQACGISVKFNERFLSFANQCLNSKPFRAFVGFYRITCYRNGQSIEKLCH